MGADEIPEQVYVDAARAYCVSRFNYHGPYATDAGREAHIRSDAEGTALDDHHLRAVVASAYCAGQAAAPDGPRTWTHRVPAEPGPEVLAVRVIETGQHWERRYAKNGPDRWAGGHWLVEWRDVLLQVVGKTLTDATPAGDGHMAEVEYLPGCPVEVWDGPYLMRCSLGDAFLTCAHHGPFQRARRCTEVAGCRRPVGHGGACDPARTQNGGDQ